MDDPLQVDETGKAAAPEPAKQTINGTTGHRRQSSSFLRTCLRTRRQPAGYKMMANASARLPGKNGGNELFSSTVKVSNPEQGKPA